MFSRTSSNICLGAIGAICLLLLIAAAAPLTISRDYKIANNTDSVKLTIQQSGTQSANAIEIYRGSNLELAIPGTNTVAGLKTKLGFDSGNKIVTSVSTNVTFATTYSAAPVVVAVGSVTNDQVWVSAVTTSNFTIAITSSSNTVRWVAVGTP